MKSPTILLLTIVLALTGCDRQQGRRQTEATIAKSQAATAEARGYVAENEELERISLNDVDRAESAAAAMERRVIRNADLTLEVSSPSEAQRKVSSIAESSGGFVVTSESKQRENVEPAKRTLDIKLVVRVPSSHFEAAAAAIEGLATNVVQRNIAGEDVTEQFIDLEARLKTQKALELQFLGIMKQATKVADALEVQRQIAEVRTEIEKLEGRKRFLENRSSLSTITVNLLSPTPIVVSTTGFGRNLRDAVSESIELATGMVLFFIRFVIVMVPVVVFVFLPLGLVAVYFTRRAKRIRLAHALQATPSSN
jgi:hypothetical protein